MQLGDKLKKLRSRKVCLHFNAGPRSCSSIMASSHSISRRQSLLAIARNGHVYTIARTVDDFRRNSGQLSLELSGIGKASTFGGFCAHHDNQLFSAIDKYDYEINEEVAALFYYRAMCRELWVRQNAELSIPAFAETAKKYEGRAREVRESILSEYEARLSIGTANLLRHKRLVEACLTAGKFRDIRYTVFHSSRPPNVMCSGVVFPERDFQLRPLQIIDRDDASILSFTVAASRQGYNVILAWHSDSDSVCCRLIESLATCLDADVDIPERLLTLMLTSFENVAIRPNWWDGLSIDVRHLLLTLMSNGLTQQRFSPSKLAVHSLLTGIKGEFYAAQSNF